MRNKLNVLILPSYYKQSKINTNLFASTIILVIILLAFVRAGSEPLWDIQKTGAEVNLNIDHIVLDNTATRFCVSFVDRVKYIDELISRGRFIDTIPIEKISGDFYIDVPYLNLTEGEKCFVVAYPNSSGIQFKIGWESILVSTGGSLTTLSGESPQPPEINITTDVTIGTSATGWNFDITEDNKTEVSTDIFEINQTTIELTLSLHPDNLVPNNYKWYMALCNASGVNNLKYMNEDAQGGFNFSTAINVNYVNKLTDFGLPSSWCAKQNNSGYVLFSSGGKNQLPKHIRLILPNSSKSFKIFAGTESVTIDATAVSDATHGDGADGVCVDSSGVLHATWQSSGDDLWYGNSSDNGTTWGSKELDSGIIFDPGIICNQNDSIFVYYGTSGTLNMYQSHNSGATFSGPIVVENDLTTVNVFSGVGDSNNIMHWCIEAGSSLYYVNSSDLDNEKQISSYDTEHCDIEVDYDNNIYIVVNEDLTDDLDILSSKDGYATRNSISDILGNVDSSLNAGGVGIDIDGVNMIHVTSIHTADLQYCNVTTDSWNGIWQCQELDASPSYYPTIAVSQAGQIYLLYQNSTTGAAGTNLINSTDGVTWSKTSVNNGEWSRIADSVWGESNRMTTKLHFIYTASSDVFYSNITIADAVYVLNVTQPNTDDVATAVDNTNLSVNFTASIVMRGQLSREQLKSGLTLQNITSAGNSCDVVSSSGVAASCSGTHNACSTYTGAGQAACQSHGCTWFASTCLGTAHACSTHVSDQSACESAGCTYTPATGGQEFGYGVTWQANISISGVCFDGLTGLQDLVVNVSYSGITYNVTEAGAIDYGEADTTPPSFSSNKTNASSTTYNGTTVQINLTITDGTAVDFYRLIVNDTSDNTWVNQTLTDAGGTSPVTPVFNYSIHNFTTSGGTMGWRVWANDTAGNVNISQIFTFVVQQISPPPVISFTVSFPATGCSQGNGCTAADCEACTYCHFSSSFDTNMINCTGQNNSIPFLNFTNDGTVTINITFNLNATINTAKIRHKLSHIYNGWETACSGGIPTAGCAYVENPTYVTLIDSLTAGSSQPVWEWADYVDVVHSDEINVTMNTTSVS